MVVTSVAGAATACAGGAGFAAAGWDTGLAGAACPTAGLAGTGAAGCAAGCTAGAHAVLTTSPAIASPTRTNRFIGDPPWVVAVILGVALRLQNTLRGG